MVNVLMRHGICLSGLLRIHLNLRRLVVFLDIYSPILVHSISNLIMPPFGMICVILLTMLPIHVLIKHAMLDLTLHHPGIILMLS